MDWIEITEDNQPKPDILYFFKVKGIISFGTYDLFPEATHFTTEEVIY